MHHHSAGVRRLTALAGSVLLAGGLLAGPAPAASAAPPVDVVHAETVTVGPYQLQASFSEWPLRSERSLDFLFDPGDGIEQMTGNLRAVSPSGDLFRPQQQPATDLGVKLVRHPRARESWGLDIVSLAGEGTWRFEFALDGPRGPGQGVLEVPVGRRPGPPAPLSWAIGLLPLIAVVPIGVYLWLRTRPGRRRETWTWS